jgi:hypothetical protein
MTSTETEVIPTLFSHSVKIEQTAKGARVTVHGNANNALEAMEQSINHHLHYKQEIRQSSQLQTLKLCGITY